MTSRRPDGPPVTPVEPAAYAIVYAGKVRLALLVDEVAVLLFGSDSGPDQRKVRRLIDAGQLPAVSTGRSYLISANAVLAWLNGTRAAAA